MNGILCLDKPPEMTSFQCCSVMRRLLNEKKIGHAGTLDPMATGLLPILAGRATKALELLPIHDKRYTAVLQFGLTSDTLDIWGKTAPTHKSPPSLADIEAVLPAFRGEIMQTPPMTSALKRDGVRLYTLARQGIEVDREARPVTIHRLDIVDYQADTGALTLDCACSKGTYIRSLCDDIGRVLGCGGVMASLRRTEAAGFSLEQSVRLDEAKDLAGEGQLVRRILPVESAFSSFPTVTITPAQTVRFLNGGALDLRRLSAGIETASLCRVYSPDGDFIGLGTPGNGELRVRYLELTAP